MEVGRIFDWLVDGAPGARTPVDLVGRLCPELVQAGITSDQQRALTDSALRGWALGEADYVADLQRRTERRVAKARVGRPFKSPKKSI